ncbi:cysteine-rich receptor-like protein kinase 20 [Artemisia annua]|uniref:Cysteine-rich receptor-like protein kinase 20 n=1 Tax=Artemisia annua TaxID=35608 RepID=A0A2U1P104_ARTAN|nr:cysteine-rich receptor-like protein kinase 20 [Artemisia annua]
MSTVVFMLEGPQDRPTMSTVVFMLEGQWSSNFPTPFEPRFSFARLPAALELTTTTSNTITDASIEPSSSYCGNENYTQNSAYQQNLDDVLFALTGTNNGFGFYNLTSGQANAAALCRGDIEPEMCRRCVDDATRRLRQVCPNQVEATGWYDMCFLKYSNRSMAIGIVVTGINPNNVSDFGFDQWNQSVVNLLGALRSEAVRGGQLRKYASGNISAGFLTVYGMMQCTPDLSATQCDNCLARAINSARRYERHVGVRTYLPDCFIRYENSRFFNSTWFPAPSAPTPTVSSSSKGTSLGVIVGPILAAVAVILGVVFFFICRSRQKQKRNSSLLPEVQVGFSDSSPEGSKHQREDDDTGEMNYFNLGIIQSS